MLELFRNGNRRQLGQVESALGNILGHVRHALQVGIDLQSRGNAAQIDGHRLMQSQDLQTLLFNMVLLLIDLGVSVDHLLG